MCTDLHIHHHSPFYHLEQSPILTLPALQPPPLLSVGSHYMESLVTAFFDSAFKAHGVWHVLLYHFLFISKTLSQLSFRPIHPLEFVPGFPPGSLRIADSGRLDWRDALDVFV